MAIISMSLAFSCNQAPKEEVKAATAAKDADAKKIEVVKSFYPMLEKGDWAGIERITDAGFIDHNSYTPPAGVAGRDSVMKGMKDFKEGFPNMKFDILHTAIDGDIVFVNYHFTASNDGPFMGMPATNKKADYTGVDMIRMKDTVAMEHWDYGDNITYMKQMGLMQ